MKIRNHPNTKSNRQIFIVIPAYNEEKVITSVIRNVKKNGYSNIIVVDDGSDDKTFLKAKKEKVHILRHILNRGKGATVKTGMEAAKMLGADIIVTLDGDNQHNPSDIKKLLDKIYNGYDVVLGSRLIQNKHMPLIKVLANYIGNLVTWIIYGTLVSDSQSGLRAYSKKAFSTIDTRHDRYEYDSEVIREIYRNNLKFCEVSIDVRYTKYSMNKLSKQSFFNGLKTLARMAMSS